MTAGQTALGISDIPFMYSFVSIVYILITGNFEDPSRLYIVGLIAGTLGTFFVFWHPIQWIIDKKFLSEQESNSTYFIKLEGYNPPDYKVKINRWFRLSLKTPAIKYLKDKIAGQIYFIIILITFSVVLSYTPFQTIIHLTNLLYIGIIQVGLLVMISGMAYFLIKQNIEFIKNVKIQSLYFLCFKENFVGDPLVLKNAIDLGDWVTAKEYADELLSKNWNALIKYS